ncbi:MAG: signal peptidase [Fuerstiella sp.]|nr:signal peptidase [Fuerstiella sp.]
MSETNQPDDFSRVVVRYGLMRILGEFTTRPRDTVRRGDAVIIRTDRGVEWGTVLSQSTSRTQDWLGGEKRIGRILRLASDEDRRLRDEVSEREKQYFVDAERVIEHRKLQMKLVDVEQVFGGERIVFFYLAEKRIDFRELVRELAKEFNARIEMRQMGVRDEARLLADYGDCGKPVCCNTHLTEMPPVSMKMAKLQKATLDPAKISGRCGRLKCCLRYEYETYEENRREMPSVGTTVVTKEGQGRVLSQELLSRHLLVSYDDGRRILTSQNDIVTVVSKRNHGNKRGPDSDPDQNQ